nr:RNA-directed DNA polymerase, eukaryota [Tanacetum cinerariifolium]
KGGLGVSSLYALNRAFMFKWVWRFTTQQDLLWTKVIKAIYGEDGRISDGSKHVPKSIWCGIVQELKAFKSKENIWSSFRRTSRSALETEQLELLQEAIGSVVLGTAEDRGVESSTHLFFVCDLAKDNLRNICRWWNVEFMEIRSFDEWASWVVNLRMPIKHKRLLEGVCFGLWWLIWSFRNKMVFGVDSPSKAAIFDDIVLFSFYWSRYRSKVSFS